MPTMSADTVVGGMLPCCLCPLTPTSPLTRLSGDESRESNGNRDIRHPDGTPPPRFQAPRLAVTVADGGRRAHCSAYSANCVAGRPKVGTLRA